MPLRDHFLFRLRGIRSSRLSTSSLASAASDWPFRKLGVMIAGSKPSEKEMMVNLVMNILA